MRCELMLKKYFADIMIKYSLKSYEVTKEKAMLLSNTYGIMFEIYYGQIELDFVKFTGAHEFVVYDIWNYCVRCFDEINRECLKESDTAECNSIEKELEIAFQILACGLEHHFSHILKGDENWLEDYSKYEYARKPQKVEGKIYLNKNRRLRRTS